MGRPRKFLNWLTDVVSRLRGREDDKPPYRSGKPPLQKERLQLVGQSGQIRAERPTRAVDFQLFAYIMDVLSNMPMTNEALWQLAEDVALDENGERSAWSVSVKIEPLDETKEAQAKAEELREAMQLVGDRFPNATGIGYNTKILTHEFITMGDAFAEQEIYLDSATGTGYVENIRQLPTWQMHVLWDDGGQLTGYEQWLYGGGAGQSSRPWQSGGESPIRWTIPQQIIHWKHRKKDYRLYGESVLAPLKGRWEQFKLIELDLIVAIHTRAVTPEIHKLGGADGVLNKVTDPQILAYKQELRDNPADINRFYVVRTGEVEIEFPKTGDADSIRALLDVHRDLENRFVEALGVPGHISGNVKDVAGRHISNSLDQKYSRKINSIRQDFTNYLSPAVDLEFALRGYNKNTPDKYGVKRISWSITWPSIGETQTQKSVRVLNEWRAGLINSETARQQLGYQNSRGMYEAIKRDREVGDIPQAATGAPISSNNDNQGPGVPTSDGDQNLPQKK